jgi:hypothetical protein
MKLGPQKGFLLGTGEGKNRTHRKVASSHCTGEARHRIRIKQGTQKGCKSQGKAKTWPTERVLARHKGRIK